MAKSMTLRERIRAHHHHHVLSVALLTALLSQACAGSGGSGTATASPTDAARRPTDPSIAELEALYRARTDSAFLKVSEADVHFMTGMISHHAQALVMSGFVPANGASPKVRTLAARIINAQKDEITLMQAWLRDRGRSVPAVSGTGHMRDGPEGEMSMPGMLTLQQLLELEEARGPDFDRAFLTYMIQHHQGAVTMVHDLFATDGAAQDNLVFKLASDVQVDQITEINRMQQMLDAFPAPGSDR